MAFVLANPDRLFDRTWRPRHPLRPRLSSGRRHCMLVLLTLLCTIIFGYSWLTNSKRVRAMAGSYLSDLLGGDVTIGQASLSIFEGLRLDDVTLRIDESDRADSTILHAQTFLIRYNPYELLTGKLTATQIVAIEPTVMLVEDPVAQQWNYSRLWNRQREARRKKTNRPEGPLALPQIILRDATVQYIELIDGKPKSMGWYTIGGTFTPDDEPDRYDFELQSRGREAMGPSVKGTLRMNGGKSSAQMWNFPFGPDIKTMLPTEPRAWCEQHELQGQVDVPALVFDPGANGSKPTFRVEIALSGVGLAVRPQEWMGRSQNDHIQWFHSVLDTFAQKQWMRPEWIHALRQLSTPQPIHLRQCSGTLVFTDQGVQLKAVEGKLENNWFSLDGKIDGYSPDSTASITAASLRGQNLDLPGWSPTYVGSLPPEVQEVCEHLHPQGTCSVWVKIERKVIGAAPVVTGRIDIQDGQFCFDDFPYPMIHTTGTILIGHDPIMGMDGIRLMNVQGRGIPGGPNENSTVSLDGFVGPFNGVAGVWIDIRGKRVSSEPAVRKALPRPVDRALRIFDPDGQDIFPKFFGDFTCHIGRQPGPHKHWEINLDVNLQDSEGSLAAFRYPIRGMSGRLEVRDGYVNVVGAKMTKGDATIGIDGVVTWKTSENAASTSLFGPNLKVVARNLPIDDDLKNALPPLQRSWLAKLGVTGKLDVDGRVVPAPGHAESDVNYTFDIGVHDGALCPLGGACALTGITGKMTITPDQLQLGNFIGQHGEGTVKGRGSVAWGANDPKVRLYAVAQKLPLDAALYQLLPADARDDWDSLQPEGSVDAAITFESLDKFELQLQPHGLSVTPKQVPYRLSDLSGTMNIGPKQVVLTDIKGKHGDADITLSGVGQSTKQGDWNFQLAGNKLAVDDDFLHALPDSVSAVVKSMQLQGKIGMEFSKLAYRPTSGTQSAKGPDMDFAAKITLDGASMDIGLPANDVIGTVELAGLVRGGELQRFAGQLSAPKLLLSGRAANDFKIILAKPSDAPIIQITRIEGGFAGGDIAGDGQITLADASPGKYDLSLVLRDADVQRLALPEDRKIKGRVTASLELGGNWNDPASRRGHGDVRVFGEDMYEIPLVLGLLQITNLTLPLSSPFSEATTRYNIDGQRVGFERIDLKSKDMTMSGGGNLDFGAKRVNLWFVTDNPTLISLPIVGPLLHSAKQELLKIRVNGTIQEPKVTASTFDTVTTTVDEVFRGDEKK
ncbi:MAG: hypothetical protein M3O30_13260 [Planctomycetota bacterium]|nr:hypothetical protein [Planctomycetota bacterium]